jgi:hypothetical protein
VKPENKDNSNFDSRMIHPIMIALLGTKNTGISSPV